MKTLKELFPKHDGLTYVLPNSEADVCPLPDDVVAHFAELRRDFIEAWPRVCDQRLVELHADDPSVIIPGKTVREVMNESLGWK